MYRSSSSTVHDRLVSSTVAEMKRQGMTNSYTQPDLIGGYIPDATAYFGSSFCVAECESSEGLAQQHTEAQWMAFFQYAVRVNGFFIAVVSQSDEATARALLQKVARGSNRALLWKF